MPLAGSWLAHGGRRGPRSPARVAGGCIWWVGVTALTPWLARMRCGNRECGLRPRAPPPAWVSGLGCDLELCLQTGSRLSVFSEPVVTFEAIRTLHKPYSGNLQLCVRMGRPVMSHWTG